MPQQVVGGSPLTWERNAAALPLPVSSRPRVATQRRGVWEPQTLPLRAGEGAEVAVEPRPSPEISISVCVVCLCVLVRRDPNFPLPLYSVRQGLSIKPKLGLQSPGHFMCVLDLNLGPQACV